MSLYISADGGGTKLQVLLFDEDMQLLGTGVSGGTNTNFITAEKVRHHMEEAITQALSGFDGPPVIDICWHTIVGPGEWFCEILKEHAKVGTFTCNGEAKCYLLAGLLKKTGCVALAGTGSGAAWVDGDRLVHQGGYGSVIGDDGSGWWIGSHGINAAVRNVEGWGPDTLLTEYVKEYFSIPEVRFCLGPIYSAPEGARSRAAGFCPWVGKAADAGDEVAIRIEREAAELLALQMAGLFRTQSLSQELTIVKCGGVWKSTPLLGQFFEEVLRKEGITAPVISGKFSPILAGPVSCLMDQGKDPEQYVQQLSAMEKALKR